VKHTKILRPNALDGPGGNYLNHGARAVQDIVATADFHTIFSNFSLYTQGREERLKSINYISEGWNSTVTQYITRFTLVTNQQPSDYDAPRQVCTRTVLVKDSMAGVRAIQFSAPVCK
jgi:hypothetical protein